MSVCDSTS